MRSESVDHFLKSLEWSPTGAVCNPWWKVDKQNDVGPRAQRIRREQLRDSLAKRIGQAQFALVGEALGYRGGHFTGIPMTSERILLGRNKDVGIEANLLFSDVTPQRTSKPQKCRDGFSEPTATIVWNTLLQLGLSPEQFVLWNALPWHSFNRHRGMLSNRMPTKSERAVGLPVLKAFLNLFPCEQVVALGRIAARQLADLNVEPHYVRHPASGGAKLFRQQIAKMVEKIDSAKSHSVRAVGR